MNKQKKILLLPGMGDIYWVMVKLESFMKQEGFDMPLVYTWELQPHKKNRSADYIQRIPFVEYGGGWEFPQRKNDDFNAIYLGTTWKLENFHGFDYLLSGNGVLRNGHSLESNGLEKYATNWFFPLTTSLEEDASRGKYKEIGDYILVYFSNAEMYNTWLTHLPITKIYEILERVHNETGHKIVLSGCAWDRKFTSQLKRMDTSNFMVDETGKTTINQFFGLVQEARGMIGFPGGNTIMSVYFKIPTIILWSKYFPQRGFYQHCIPPESIGRWHEYIVVEDCNDVDIISDKLIKLL